MVLVFKFVGVGYINVYVLGFGFDDYFIYWSILCFLNVSKEEKNSFLEIFEVYVLL